MSVERHEVGARMSQAVVHNGTVYLAGQVAQNAAGASITEQVRDILQTTDRLLAACGTDKSKLLSATIWLNSMNDFDEMNTVWGQLGDAGSDALPGLCRIGAACRPRLQCRNHGNRGRMNRVHAGVCVPRPVRVVETGGAMGPGPGLSRTSEWGRVCIVHSDSSKREG